MDFETDPLVEELSRNEKKETFGFIICALFHQPKPILFSNFYNELIRELKSSFTDDEKQAVYLYSIDYLHITIATLINFKNPWPESPEKYLEYWKESFKNLKQTSKNQSIHIKLDKICLSKAAGFFLFNDENNSFGNLRQTIREICIPEENQEALIIPNIVHTSFMRFIKKPNNPKEFEEKFHRICQEIFKNTNEIYFNIDEICLAFEGHPYMHIPCDKNHVLDIMKC